MQELKYKPIAFFKMNTASPFTDLSGFGRTGTLSAARVTGLPLINDASTSTAVDSSSYATFTVPGLYDNNEDSFSISAVVYPREGDEWQAIVSHGTSWLDGLSIKGTLVSFSTFYDTEGFSSAEYNVETIQKLDLVGVHNPNSNRLFINGQLVAESDISDEQREIGMSFPASPNNFYCGSESGDATKLLVNNVAFFNRALTAESVEDIYNTNNQRSPGSPVKGFEGEEISFSRSTRPHYLAVTWDDEAEWNIGVLDGTTVDGDVLSAQWEDGLTIAGLWTDSVYLEENLGNPLPIDCINLDWSGENVEISVSVNEDDWEVVRKGRNIVTIPVGFTPTDQQLYVRAKFEDGLPNAYLTSLRVDGYLEGVMTPVSGRELTFSKVANRYEAAPALMRDDWAADVDTGGYIAIGPDTDEQPLEWKTLEIWVKPRGTLSTVIGGSPTASATYTNGVAGLTTPLHQWVVYHYTFASAINPTVTLGGNCILGKVAFYPDELSAGQIAHLVANYTGTYNVYQDEIGTMTIQDDTQYVSIVDPQWLHERAH